MLTYSELAGSRMVSAEAPFELVETSEGLLDPSISAAVVALDWSQLDQLQHTGVITPEFPDGTFWDVRAVFNYDYPSLDEEKRRKMMERIQQEAVLRFRRSYISANLPPQLSQQSRFVDYLSIAPIDEICGTGSSWDSTVQQAVYGAHSYPVGIVGVRDIGVVGSIKVPGRFSLPGQRISAANLSVQPIVLYQSEVSSPAL